MKKLVSLLLVALILFSVSSIALAGEDIVEDEWVTVSLDDIEDELFYYLGYTPRIVLDISQDELGYLNILLGPDTIHKDIRYLDGEIKMQRGELIRLLNGELNNAISPFKDRWIIFTPSPDSAYYESEVSDIKLFKAVNNELFMMFTDEEDLKFVVPLYLYNELETGEILVDGREIAQNDYNRMVTWR